VIVSTAFDNILLFLILILWLVQGDIRNKLNSIKDNHVILAPIIYLTVIILGISWADDIDKAFKIIDKQSIILALPVIYTSFKRENLEKVFVAFSLAGFISAIMSFVLYFGIASWSDRSVEYPIPFVRHISFNTMLSFAIIFLLNRVFYKKIKGKERIYYFISILIMSLSVFITRSRAGMIAFLFMCFIWTIYYFRKNYKAMLKSFSVILIVLIIAIVIFADLRKRIDEAYKEIINYKPNVYSSVGARFTFAMNSWELTKKFWPLGTGTGGFEKNYKIVNKKNTPDVDETVNPHNNYLFVLVQLGFPGILVFLNIFFQQILFFFKKGIEDEFNVFRIMLPLVFMLICLSDSYLFGHHTQLFFMLMTAILYRSKSEISNNHKKI